MNLFKIALTTSTVVAMLSLMLMSILFIDSHAANYELELTPTNGDCGVGCRYSHE